MLLARAEVTPGVVRDLRLRDGRIVERAPQLAPQHGEAVLDAGGAAVLPGLHDHHVHLRATAAAAGSLDLRGVTSEGALRDRLRRAVEEAPGPWLRVVGYHDAIAGPLDRVALDRLAPTDRPVRVQHRSGVLWVLNSAAMAATRLDQRSEPGVDAAAGHLWRRDDLLRSVSQLDPSALREVGRRAAAAGITGFTDATPGSSVDDPRRLADDLRAAGVHQRLLLMGPAGARPPEAERASLGPVKVLLDDDALPALDDLAERIGAAHDERRAVAVHCVTRVQLVLTLAALEAAGARDGDRIEHASVVPPELVPELARLGVTVVTQPHFVAERGDEYLADVDEDDRGSLYRVRSLLDAGIPVAAGTDAPFGALDPWASMRAAIDRCTPAGQVLAAGEAVDVAAALGLHLGEPGDPGRARSLAVGAPADLCLLRVPWSGLETSLEAGVVAATAIAGEVVHTAG